MGSIVGEKYRNAESTGSGWTATDKIFGYLDKAGDIYNEIRYPQYKYNTEEYIKQQNIGMFGLPKPWGFLLLAGGVSLLAWGVYSIAKK